ncbi:ABC transporter permease [Natranaerovirga hydrolytica]|nr:ABC-2 family transporter protein [Natranaerovirga hydrolytica]
MYLVLMKMVFHQQFLYRSEMFFNFLGNVLRIVIQVSIWTSLMGIGGIVEDITLSNMITYTVISIIIRMLVHSEIATVFSKKVKTGEIVVDFIKPVSLKSYMFSQQISENTFNFIIIGLPLLLFSQLVYGLEMIANGHTLFLFLIALILGIVIMFYIDYILGTLIFWVKNNVYVYLVRGALFEIFSGVFVPLWFYPDFLLGAVNYLPFRLVAFEPIAIYLGKTSIKEAYDIILLQVIWIILLYIIQKLLWHIAQSKVFIQGG